MTAEVSATASAVQKGGQPATETTEDIYARGIANLEIKDMRRALDDFEAVLTIDPEHALATYQIGTIAQDLGDAKLADRYFGDAITLLKVAVSENDGLKCIRLALIDAAAALHRRDEMRMAAEAVVKTFEFDLVFQQVVALRLLDNDVFDVALSILQRCIDRGLRRAETYANLGIALCNLGREADAIAALETAIALEPETEDFYERLARIYRRNNLTADKAVAVLRRGLRIAPAQSLYTYLAESLETCGRYEEAVDAYRQGCRATETGEPGVGMLFGLSHALSLAGHEQEANKVREHLLSKLGVLTEAGMSNQLATCFEIDLLWSVGRRDQAMETYRKMRGDSRIESFAFHPYQHSTDIPARLGRLRRTIRNRDVFVLAHGPSVKDLEARIGEICGQGHLFHDGA